MLNSSHSRPSNSNSSSSYSRRSSANPIPASSEPLVRPQPTRQRSVSNVVNPSNTSTSATNLSPSNGTVSTTGYAAPPPITSTTSWFNTLADGLNWIEVQGGNVVTSATQASGGLGLGETIRGGLQGVGGVVQGGLSKRPLSLGFGGGTPPVSENGDAGSENGGTTETFMLPPPVGSGHGASSLTTTSTPLKRRPASFLGLMKPRPQTPPSSHSYQTNPTPSASPLWDRASSPINNNSSTANTTTNTISPPAPPIRTSSIPSEPTKGRPTVTRLGPPRPSNLARIRGNTEISASGGGSSSSSNGMGGGRSMTDTTRQGGGVGSGGGTGAGGLVKSGSTGSVDRLAITQGDPSTTTTMNGNPNRRRVSGWEGPGGSIMMERQSSSSSTIISGSRSGTPGPPPHPNNGNAPGNGNGNANGQNVNPASSPSPLPGRTRSYKPGFQPVGVRSDRTEAFELARRKVAEDRGREEGRLGKRWGKLIDLHFNPMAGLETTAPGLKRSNTSNSVQPSSSSSRPSLSSLPSVNLNLTALGTTFDGIKPKDVWRGFRSVTGVGLEQVEFEKKREVEKGLVVWEEDGEVRRCRICQSIFSLTNRKHHCRLCGRIVCSLAPTSQAILALTAPTPTLTPSIMPDTRHVNPRTGLPLGTRRETCSLLLVADYRTGRGQEVDENFVGWMQMGNRKNVEVAESSSPSSSSSTTAASARRPDEVQVKGVRTCRECWQTVSRKQKMADRNQVDKFTRLYAALKSLEGEISETVPEYQDAMEEISRSTDPAGPIPIDVMNLHKHLIALFAEYDGLTKRVRAYPCGSGSARERVQVAIARQASLFMAKEAGVLQLLPKIQKQRHKRATSSIMSADSTPAGSEMAVSVMPASIVADDQTALMLQPLLEQEAQLEAFIAEAKAQRKLEDAMTLQMSLEELRQEIARIASG